VSDTRRNGIDVWSTLEGPIFFERNRVFRVYRGGKLFHDFFGDAEEDGFYPEEWVASTVKALNKEPRSEHEGLSIVRRTEISLRRLVEEHREALIGPRRELGLLVKLLDSAIRLPVQAHPDKAFARRHFGSPHGKTEMWLVLATRENACLYFGFKEGVTQRDLTEAMRASETDKNALPGLLNELPAKEGEVYLIPARVAHAIGAGCLILEVQEPTDFTIQPEAWCGDYHLSPFEMYLGLDEAAAMDCFDFTDLVGERALAAGRKLPRSYLDTPSLSSEHLLRYEDTPDFSVNRHRLRGGRCPLGPGPAVYVVTAGEGRIESRTLSGNLRKGDYFFLPACVEDVVLENSAVPGTRAAFEVVECLPPEPTRSD
jgi:mannose-6-phosphate isomerase